MLEAHNKHSMIALLKPMLCQCKVSSGRGENSYKDLLPSKRNGCKACICFLLCNILGPGAQYFEDLNKHVVALGLSRSLLGLSLSIKTEMVVPTGGWIGGCILDPLFRQSNVCSRKPARTFVSFEHSGLHYSFLLIQ